MSDLSDDIETIDQLIELEGISTDEREAWQRIRARLTPDRERVARAIAQSNQAGSDNGWQMFLPDADAAIAAMGEP